MKQVLLIFLIFSSVEALAFPEKLRTDRLSQGVYDQQKQCTLDYCKNNDGGFSMRNWCSKNNGKWGEWPVVVGWADVNGFKCFCGCNNLW